MQIKNSFIFLFFSLFLLSCASSTSSILIALPPRTLEPPNYTPPTKEAQLFFTQHAAYIIGLSNDNHFSVNTWVRARSSSKWPEDEPAPTLLVGQVLERSQDWARLEILSIVDSIRSEPLLFEEIEQNDLPAITKRLSFALDGISAKSQELIVPLGSDALRTGQEIYAAVDLDETQPLRLASRIKAILRLSVKDETSSTLELLSGSLPKNPAFLLLFTQAQPAHKIDIQIQESAKSCLGNLESALRQTLASATYLPLQSQIELQKNSLDTPHIQISCQSKNPKLQSRLQDFGFLEPVPNLLAHAPQNLNANVILIHAAQALGLFPYVALWAESAIREYQSPEAYAMLAPILVSAYSSMERADFALELSLILQALNKGKHRTVPLLLAELESWTILGRVHESQVLLEELSRNKNKLNPGQLNQVLSSLIRLQNQFDNLPALHAQWLSSAKKQRSAIDEVQFCILQSLATGEDEACQRILGEDHKNYQKVYARFFSYLSDLSLPLEAEFINTLSDLIALPAPSMLAFFFAKMATQSDSDPIFLRAIHLAALNSYQAQRYAAAMAYFSTLDDQQSHLSLAPFSDEGSREYLTLLSTLDKRTRLIQRSIEQALSPSTAQDDQLNLLSLAAELAISIGDEENAAIALSNLAKSYDRAKLHTQAHALAQRARAFAKNIQNQKILSLIREIQNL